MIIYYVMVSVGQEFKQGTEVMAYLCSMMSRFQLKDLRIGLENQFPCWLIHMGGNLVPTNWFLYTWVSKEGCLSVIILWLVSL